MMEERKDTFRERVNELLVGHTTMELATVDEAGLPAVASLFYAHDEAWSLYYLSSTSAQHSQNVALNSRVAVAIHANVQDWREIQGLQMRGRARRVPATRLPHAIRLYGAKYAFIKLLLAGAKSGPAELVEPLAQTRFYVFEPTWVRLIDNRVSFGHKEELDLTAG